jgi:hypothetical protein
MPQTKILVDSCSYFRLAQNIHPLLAAPFGKAAYTLYAHAALTEEFARAVRLKTKFDWVLLREYVVNRSRPLQIGRKEAAAIEFTYGYIWAHVLEGHLGPSPVDVRILATAAELNLRLITDDTDLFALAEQYGVEAMTSLELMELMVKERHIDMDKVRQVVAQWTYDRDEPANFRQDYARLFGEEPTTD